MNILQNPQNYQIPLEEQFTHNQLLALQHNEEIKDCLTHVMYELNIETIKSDRPHMYIFKENGNTTTCTCGKEKSESQLKADLFYSLQGSMEWKKPRKSTAKKI